MSLCMTPTEQAHLIATGQLRLQPGSVVPFNVLALLPSQTVPMAHTSSHGAPGSRMALDASQASRSLAAASQARAKAQALEASAGASGTPEERAAQKILAAVQASGIFPRTEHQHRRHLQEAACMPGATNAAVAVRIMDAQDRNQSDDDKPEEELNLAQLLIRRMRKTFADAEVKLPTAKLPTAPAPRRPDWEKALAGILERLEKIQALLEHKAPRAPQARTAPQGTLYISASGTGRLRLAS